MAYTPDGTYQAGAVGISQLKTPIGEISQSDRLCQLSRLDGNGVILTIFPDFC